MAADIDMREIPLSKVRANPFQPRQSFPREGLEELAASIKVHGLLQPILVRPKDGSFQVACGERRLRATEMAGLKQIPAIVREMDDKMLQLCSVVENLHRLDLTPPEKEKAMHDLWKKYYEPEGLSQTKLAGDIGFEHQTVNSLILSYEDRNKIAMPLIRREATTKDLAITRKVPESVREDLLEKKVKGEITGKDMERMVPILKEAKPERAPTILRQVVKEIKKTEDFKEEVRKEAGAFGRGEIEATEIKAVKSADLNRVDRFKETRDQTRFWTVASIEVIENEKLRLKAVEYVRDARDYCETLLRQLEKRKWYAKTK